MILSAETFGFYDMDSELLQDRGFHHMFPQLRMWSQRKGGTYLHPKFSDLVHT